MTQPTLPNRRRPVFLRCPVCGTEFRSTANQRWCSRDCGHAARHRAREAPPEHRIAEKLKDRL
jgi:tRNA(Ile2) C34 agmatinyltransferase TiaS